MQTAAELLRARWRIACALTLAMVTIYFGFISAVAFRKEWMARLVVPGLSLGILLGALVIGSAWVLTFLYVRWANSHLDPQVERLRQEQA